MRKGMSIILEALKKAAKENPAEAMGIEKSYETPEFELEKPEIKIPEVSASILSRPTFISLAIIAIGAFLLFSLPNERDLPVAKKTEPQVQPTSLALTEKPTPMAEVPPFPQKERNEGCTPINIFKIKHPNPMLTLNGIVSGIGKPAVIIDNKIAEEGASINGAKIVKIYDDRVALQNEASGETFTLRVY